MRRLRVKAKALIEDIECEVEFIGLNTFKVLKGDTQFQFYDYTKVSEIQNLKYEQICTNAAEQWINSGSDENLCADLIDHNKFLAEYSERLNVEEDRLLNVLLAYCDRFYLRCFLEAYKLSSILEADFPKTVLGSIRSKVYQKKKEGK